MNQGPPEYVAAVLPTQLDSTAAGLLFLSDFKRNWNLYTNFGTLLNSTLDVMLRSGGVRLFVKTDRRSEWRIL